MLVILVILVIIVVVILVLIIAISIVIIIAIIAIMVDKFLQLHRCGKVCVQGIWDVALEAFVL